MFRSSFRFRCAVFGAAAFVLPACALEVDGIAARVGTEVVLRSDILDEMRRMGATEDQYVEIRNQMIDRKLILKAAADAKMTMQEWVIENRIREIVKKGFEGDRNKLMDALGKQKVSYPEWRARMKDDMVVSAMRYQVVDKNVSASPSEMRREYETHKSRYAIGSTMTVSIIMLQPDEVDRREEISAKLKDRSFADLGAKQYKDVKPEDLFRKELCDELTRMPKGTISHWIELDGWSYLLRKDDENPGRVRSFEDAVDDVEANVKEETAKRLYTAWLERLKAETYIKVY